MTTQHRSLLRMYLLIATGSFAAVVISVLLTLAIRSLSPTAQQKEIARLRELLKNEREQRQDELNREIIRAMLRADNDAVAARQQNEHPPPEEMKSLAWLAAQELVKSRLKSPATADFGDQWTEGVTETDPNTFDVIGYVDSQNGFGALIRSWFHLTVVYHKGDWHLEGEPSFIQ